MRNDVLDCGVTLAVLEPTRLGGIDNGPRHGVREVLLQAGGETQDVILAPAVCREDAGEPRLCLALANDSKYLAPLTMTPILAASLMAVMTATEPVSLSAHE